ncbi:Vacuolar protein sorting-associated protein 13, partial [Tieghemiomyces parasiticus]
YQDLLLLASSFDYYLRQHRYRRFRPAPGVTVKKDPRAWLQYAMRCVLSEVHERNRKWSWAYFEERREDRLRYLRLYRTVKLDPQAVEARRELEALERKLSFQDIRLYRSIVESKLRKEKALTAAHAQGSILKPTGATAAAASGGPEADSQPPQQHQHSVAADAASWVGSWFGSWSGNSQTVQPGQTLTEEQLQELYDTIEYDEREAVPDYDLPDECVLLQVNMQLNHGSFTVKQAPRRDRSQRRRQLSSTQKRCGLTPRALLSVNFETFRLGFVKRPRSFTANLSLHSFHILDGTTERSLYPYLVSMRGVPPTQLMAATARQAHAASASEANISGASDLDRSVARLHRPDSIVTRSAADEHASKSPTIPFEAPTNVGTDGDQVPLRPTTKTDDPFFRLTFDHKPLDGRASSALALHSRGLNFFFNPHAIETLVRFFRPPVPARDSVQTLIAAAGRSVEGIKQQTRAGLQFALEEHSTIDVQIDLDAPVFILPSSYTHVNALVTVLDSGHLRVRTRLVAPDRMAEWRAKEGHEISAAELDELKELMYDRFAIDLTAVQLVVGESVPRCLDALEARDDGPTGGDLHVVNRLDLTFDVGLSIVPQDAALPKIVVRGHLPSVKLNFSDRKYRAIMKLVDMMDFLDRLDAVEDGDSDGEGAGAAQTPASPATPQRTLTAGSMGNVHDLLRAPTLGDSDAEEELPLPPGLTGPGSPTSSVSDSDDSDAEFFDAEAGAPANDSSQLALSVRQLTLHLTIAELSASLRRSDRDIEVPETYLAELKVRRFVLDFTKRPLDMTARVRVDDMAVEDRMHYGSYLLTAAERQEKAQANSAASRTEEHDHLEATAGDKTGDDEPPPLLRLLYKRVDPASPEFLPVYEGMRQSVEVDMSSVTVNVVRGSILTLYDFILKTFVPPDENQQQQTPASPQRESDGASHLPIQGSPPSGSVGVVSDPSDPATVRVRVCLHRIHLQLHNDQVQLATLSLSHADVAVLVRSRTLRVGAKLGTLSLTDDAVLPGTPGLDNFRQLLTMAGDGLANFSYETFDPATPATYPGFDAALFLRVGATRLTVANEPLQALIEFGSRFAQMHGLFEAARKAAAEQATQLQERASRFHFNIHIQAPTLVFPESTRRPDILEARLGELTFENRFVAVGDDGEPLHDAPNSLRQRLDAVGPHWLPPLTSGAMSPDGYALNPDYVRRLSTAAATAEDAGPTMNKMYLQVRSIGLLSHLYLDPGSDRMQELAILDDIDLAVAINYLPYCPGGRRPETEITAKLSDVRMHLTERQYRFLLHLATTLPRVFTESTAAAVASADALERSLSQLTIASDVTSFGRGRESDRASADSFAYPDDASSHSPAGGGATSKLALPHRHGPPPVAPGTPGEPVTGAGTAATPTFATLDLVFNLDTVDLELFRGDGTGGGPDLADASFTQFRCQHLVVKHRADSQGATEAELQVHTLAVRDTRPRSDSQFRDLIPAADHDGPQLLARVDARPGEDTVLIATVDHPRVVLDLNHLYALRDYFMSAFAEQEQQRQRGDGSAVSHHGDGLGSQGSGSDQSPPTLQPATTHGSSTSDVARIPAQAPASVGRTAQAAAAAVTTRPTTGSNSRQNNRPRPTPASEVAPSPSLAAAGTTGKTDTAGFAYRINIVSPEVLLLNDATRADTEAVVLAMEQAVVAQQGLFALTLERVNMALCRMDRREETLVNFIDPFDVVLSMHNAARRAEHLLTNVIVDVKPLVLRVSYEDISLLLEIAQRASQLAGGGGDGKQGGDVALVPATTTRTHTSESTQRRPSSSPAVTFPSNTSDSSTAQSTPSLTAHAGGALVPTDPLPAKPVSAAVARSTSNAAAAAAGKVTVSREVLKLAFQGFQVVLIGNKIDIPVVDVLVDAVTVNVADWSTQLKVDANLRVHANYYNLQSSHWEPLVEPWQVGIHVQTVSDPTPTTRMDIRAAQRLDINISHAFLQTLLNSTTELTRDPANYLYRTRTEHVPYRIKNLTGTDLYVWNELPSGHRDRTQVQLLADRAELPWRFGDWHRSRDVIVKARNRIGVQFAAVQLESLKDIPVDREGSKLYRLRPKLDLVTHRLAVDVTLKGNVKEVVLRSALVFENRTLLPLELVMVDQNGHPVGESFTVAPAQDCPIPLLKCHRYGVRLRPADGSQFGWSQGYIYWPNFLTGKGTAPTTVVCPSTATTTPTPSSAVVTRLHQHQQQAEGGRSSTHQPPPPPPDFYLRMHARYKRNDPSVHAYPFMTIRLSAPLELENLLPYDVEYTVVDRDAGREWQARLARGAVAPLHLAPPRHLLLLRLSVPDTPFTRSRFAVINAAASADIAVDDTLALVDRSRRELLIRLDRRPLPDTGGAHIVSVYAPYIMLNQTGLHMHLKSRSLIKSASVAAGQGSEGIPSGDAARPFMFAYDSFEPRNRCLIQFPGADWSKPLSFDAVGTLLEVVIPATAGATATSVHVGVSVEPGPGKFSRSKVVTFTPRYVLKNNTGLELQFRELGTARSTPLGNDTRVPLHFIHAPREKQLTLNAPTAPNHWSAPFPIDEVGRLFVKLPTTRQSRILVRVDVLLEGPCVFIMLSQVTGEWPFRIENASDVEVLLYQHDPSLHNGSGGSTGGDPGGSLVKKYRLPPGKSMSYAWDYPSVREKLLVLNVRGRERHVDVQQIGTLVPFKFASATAYPNTMSLDVVADHTTQVLRLTPYHQSRSIFKPRLARRDTLREAFELADVRNVTTLTFRLRLAGVGVSLINAKLQELLYATLRGIEFKFIDSTCNQSLNWMIEWIQVDNQLYGGLNEILLYPTLLPRPGQETETRPTLHMALVRAKDASYGVNYLRYFSVLLQEMSLEMDEDFLFSLLEFARFDTGGEDGGAGGESPGALRRREDQICAKTVCHLSEPTVPQDELQLYFEVLHIQPLKFNLSFVRTQRINQELDPLSSVNPLMVIGNAFTMAVGNVNDAPVKLNALVIENVRASASILLDRFTQHYTQEALYQIHKVLGSADVLGNPVGLFNNISSGVADFFYEPYHGFVMSDRPQDFGIGLARGTYSLFSKTVYGFSDSFSKFAESVSKGLSVATLDKAYQDRRRIARTRNRPRHALYGVSQGATSFASSVASGITGVVMQPIQGAERDGVGGFFKGVGKGLVGVVTKPMVGVLDLASHVTEGIKNTTTVFSAVDLDRVRLPRFVARDGILHPYNQRDALGQYWLKQINNGEYFYETYLAHLELRGSEMVALVTYTKILLIKSRSLSVEWALPLSSLQSINLEATGISLVLRGNEPGPFIPIPEASSRRWLYQKFEEAVRELTQRKGDE